MVTGKIVASKEAMLIILTGLISELGKETLRIIMNKHRNLAIAVVKSFPNKTVFDVEKEIVIYNEYKNKTPDWENIMNRFSKILKVAIQNRHRRL